MELGLFSRLQSYFDASFGGRYVACLIKESIEENPKLAKVLFNVSPSDILQLEFPFKVAGKNRIADLAFLNPETHEPTCLVELKYDDHKSVTNAQQIDLYLKYCKQKQCRFLLVSQHCPPESLTGKLPAADSLILFSDLAEKLGGREDSVGGMLRRFFVDRGLVMHKFESKDLANLKSFVLRLLTPWGGQGRIHSKEAMGGGVADAFGYLLRNMNILAKEVATHESGKAPTVDFELNPWVYPKQVLKQSKLSPNEDAIPVDEAKAGGWLNVYGRIRLDDSYKGWLQVEFGIGLAVNRGYKDMDISTYASIYSQELGSDWVFVSKPAGVTILDNKKRAVAALKGQIKAAIKEATKQDISKRQIAMLQRFGKRVR